jgi:16S rRNA (uracil1498-N3)-methyltransferase
MSPYDPGIRLYVDDALAAGAAVRLNADQAHYLRHVMRVKPGETVLLFNGRDGEWRGKIADLGKKGGTATVGEQTRPFKPAPDLWLLFAPIKRARIDFIAQKASELGVSGLWPVMTEYTNVSRVNVDRLRANAIEAAEQCGRLDVPEVFTPAPLRNVVGDWPEERRILLCDESRTGISLADTLAAQDAAAPWAVLVGPEGGFAPAELDLLHSRPQIVSVGLGDRLLRADTAAVAALACWQALLGDWR